ncbi:unnamed protein product [Mucor hiemalis]
MSAIHSGIHFIITRVIIQYYYKQNVSNYTVKSYILQVLPCGIAAAIEICCANASLVFITLSFYTMIKSSTPVWVLIFSFLFGLEKLRLNLVMIISVIVLGICLTIDGETNFDTKGFILVSVSAISSGLRWNLTQLLMKSKPSSDSNNDNNNSPLSTMYHTSPVMFITMLILSLIIEKPFHYSQLTYLDSISLLLVMSFGGILAFIMTIAELYLIKGTSTVTLSVAGITKEILVIGLSVVIYGDVLTSKTYIGYVNTQ